jgi:hypothetical protein
MFYFYYVILPSNLSEKCSMILSRKIAVLFLLLSVVGCSSTGDRGVIQSSKERISPNAVATLVVTSPADSASEKVARSLESRLTGALTTQRIFARIAREGQRSNYELSVSLNQVREVTPLATFMLGVFAGSDEIHADVKLTNRSTRQVVTRFTANGKGAAHPLSSERGMEAALSELENQIIQGLR